ncbi:hypothetical protein JCM5353_000950 [Sporobolomyces roseus]
MFVNFSGDKVDPELVKLVISSLPLFRIAFGASSFCSALLDTKRIHKQFPVLQVLALHGIRLSSVIRELSQIPSLRFVELHDLSLAIDVSPTPTAPQVTQIGVVASQSRNNLTPPLEFLPFFPSATIVKLDLCCIEYTDLRSLLLNLTPSLHILRLKARSSTRDLRWEPVDDLLALFPHLRELHLDRTFHTSDIHKHLLLLPQLVVDLGLVLGTVNPDFVQLLKGPVRLRYLSTLELDFVPVHAGEDFDFEVAISDTEDKQLDEDVRHFSTTVLDNCHSIWEMKGWNMPFGEQFQAGSRVAEKMEAAAREADVIVSTNLAVVRQGFLRQLVEYHNRGIGRLYLHSDGSTYEDAYRLAESYKIELPILGMDTKEKVERGNFEWYKVRMEEAEQDGNGECYALSLRYKEIREGYIE